MPGRAGGLLAEDGAAVTGGDRLLLKPKDGVATVQPQTPLLAQVEYVSKTFLTKRGRPVEALRDVTFEVQEGEFLTIVGPSGCGKSTFLNLFCGLTSVTEGTISIAGEPVTGPRSDVGIVFQEPVLLPWCTVLDNVLVPARVLGLPLAEYKTKARALLKVVGLAGFEHTYPGELSGGMQQRVAITRALIHDPKVLLMDEPFGALDAMTRESMNVELLHIWQDSRKTILFVTHSIPEAVFLSDRVIVMSPRPGRIADIVTIDLHRPRRLEMAESDAFGVFTRRIRQHFQARGSIT